MLNYPDPILTANIYCSGCLDGMFYHILRPLQLLIRKDESKSQVYIWSMRYGCRGEHLKVRIHGPERILNPLRSEFARLADNYLTKYHDIPCLNERVDDGRLAPPIDIEDEIEAGEDRTWLWTKYRRSHVSLCGEPFINDNAYVSRFTRCLSAACDAAVGALKLENGSLTVPYRVRHNSLTKLIIKGLAILDFEAEHRLAYLYYHRDWLIRFPLLKANETPRKAREITEHFEHRWSKIAASLESLRQVAYKQWAQDPISPDIWQKALIELSKYITPLCENPAYYIDPFAVKSIYAPLFKAFHGAANQLGLSMLDEAFIYHLLARTVAPGDPAQLNIAFEPKRQW